MTNIEIARLLRKIAAAYTILGDPSTSSGQGNRFKIIAYDNAATAVEHATSELHDLWKEKELDSVPGLGASIIGHLDEIFRTGKSKHFAEVLAKINPAVFPLLEVPGIGPKKSSSLVKSLKLNDPKTVITDLEKAAKQHKIAPFEGFGEKSEQDILENIARFRQGAIKEKRMALPEADAIAEEVIAYLKSKLGKKALKIDKLGSLRREVATIGDIDLAVATHDPEEVLQVFIDYPKKTGVIERGPTGASILLASSRQADLRVAKPEEYGAMLQYFTGSKYHNIRLRDYALKQGFSLSEYGIKDLKTKKLHKFTTEEEFYGFLKMAWIPPEIREDREEIEAALKNKLPKLAELKDIKGDLNLHSSVGQETSHDSGLNSPAQIIAVANELGYDYVAISDHNPSTAKHNPKEMLADLQDRKMHFEHIKYSTPIGSGPSDSARIINLLEVDIQPDGSLPIPQEGLDLLDGCLVAIHSSFGMTKTEMTKRVLTGLANPVARIFAHPTGRLLGSREGYDLDWDQIFKFCLENNKALEINSFPNRLDLPDTLVYEAVKRGVLLSLGTDSHVIDSMNLMKYGVSVARRGWAEKKNIINTWDYNRLLEWMHVRKPG